MSYEAAYQSIQLSSSSSCVFAYLTNMIFSSLTQVNNAWLDVRLAVASLLAMPSTTTTTSTETTQTTSTSTPTQQVVSDILADLARLQEDHEMMKRMVLSMKLEAQPAATQLDTPDPDSMDASQSSMLFNDETPLMTQQQPMMSQMQFNFAAEFSLHSD